MSSPIFSSQKLYLSGDCLEHYIFRTPVLSSFSRRRRSVWFSRGSSSFRSRFSLSRTKNSLRRLIQSNARVFNKFFTFTFKRNIKDISFANDYFKKFIKRYRYAFARKLQYVSIIEFQKRGAIHYHTLCNSPFVPQKEILRCWGAGFVSVNKIKDSRSLGSYCSKYLLKESFDSRFTNKKKYFASRGVLRPIIMKDDFQITDLIDTYKNQNLLIPEIQSQYKHLLGDDIISLVDYNRYSLKI